MNATALIAEDEPLLAQALQAELARAWPELRIVETVGDGASAVRAALEHRPDVLFFDIRMPGDGGLDAAAELADHWPAGTPFPALVFVTAFDQYALQAFDAQAVDYVLKPVQGARLQKTVNKVKAVLGRRGPGDLDATLGQLRQPAAGGWGTGSTPAATEGDPGRRGRQHPHGAGGGSRLLRASCTWRCAIARSGCR